MLHSLDELPQGSRVCLYGSGRFGLTVNDLIHHRRPDIDVLCFIDSFQDGEAAGLPVIRLERFSSEGLVYTHILITSSAQEQIQSNLARYDLTGQTTAGLAAILESDTRTRFNQLVEAGVLRIPKFRQIIEDTMVDIHKQLFPDEPLVSDLFFRILGMDQRQQSEEAQKLYGLMLKPQYNEDRLITSHLCNHFLDEPRFKAAFAAAVEGLCSFKDKRWRMHVLCWAATQAAQLEGDFVECGVGSAVYSTAVTHYLEFQRMTRSFYLLDTFVGVPLEQLTPEELTLRGKILYKHEETYDLVKKRFKDYPNVKLVQGMVPDTLSQVPSEKIAYLSLDLNHIKPELEALQYFWDKLSSGALVILDDYANSILYASHVREYNRFAAEKGVVILTLPTGQGLILKP